VLRRPAPSRAAPCVRFRLRPGKSRYCRRWSAAARRPRASCSAPSAALGLTVCPILSSPAGSPHPGTDSATPSETTCGINLCRRHDTGRLRRGELALSWPPSGPARREHSATTGRPAPQDGAEQLARGLLAAALHLRQIAETYRADRTPHAGCGPARCGHDAARRRSLAQQCRHDRLLFAQALIGVLPSSPAGY